MEQLMDARRLLLYMLQVQYKILYIFLTLIIGAVAKYFLKLTRHRFVLPYTVFVLLLGCIYGAAAQPSCAIKIFSSIAQTDPNVILLIFLPALIYEAAFCMKTYLFKKLFWHIALIGTVGMAINIVAVAYISTEVFATTPGWTIQTGLLFSAIVSATDPVAAVALLHEAGTAKSLMIVLEGTSLLSDTSAVVLFNLFQSLMHLTKDPQSDTMDILHQVQVFALNIFGGPAWGLCVGFLLTQLLSRMSSVWEAELILILSVPYLVFWSADAGFGISGALATAVLGLWMSSHRTSISPDVEVLVNRIWELVALISNTLIFSLVGIIIIDTTTNHVTQNDWILLIIINIFILLVRAGSFLILKPILMRFGIGAKVFTWSHTFVMIWAGFKGAVTLALGILGAKDYLFDDYLEVRSRLLFHTAGVVAFTLLFNATTMRFFLKRLGILDIPLSKMITMHMALKQILLTRHQKLDALKTDRYLADADWQRVEDLTKVEGTHYGIEDDGQTSLWTIHYVTREVNCPNCQAEVQLEPLPNELEEMENIGRLRLVNAKKTSYWRQYEEGTLSQSGIKQLDYISETVLNDDKGVIGQKEIKRVLENENWTAMKHRVSSFYNWIDKDSQQVVEPPPSAWRRVFYNIAQSAIFKYFIYFIIVLNVVETIADWTIRQDTTTANSTTDSTLSVTSTTASFAPSTLTTLLAVTSDSTVNTDSTTTVLPPAQITPHLVFLYTNLGFTIIYTLEAIIKITGLGFRGYWGKGYFLTWNRFDFLLLLLTYVDVTMDFLAEFSTGQIKGVAQSKPFSASLIRIFRFFRLIRFGRALRLMKPLVPPIVRFLDRRISSHLFLAYDVAKAFIVAQEECSLMVPAVIGYKPLAIKFKVQADVDCRVILKEMGLLNEQRPDVAAAVKTRQAIRSILNHLHKSVEHMRNQGILDEDEVNHLQATIEDRLKRLHQFPHSIAVVRPLDRLWNVPWINGNIEAFKVMKILFEERHYDTATQLMTADEEADGVYVVISGVISLSYPKFYSDNVELGEIYNSDNLKTTSEDSVSADEMRLDYVLAGGLLNEQCLALDFPRRSHAISDTVVNLLYLDMESLFRTLATLPTLEARFWRRIASAVALNILIKAGSISDSTYESEKARLARAAVRLVRPHVRITGLEEFDEIFLITGTLTDMTGEDEDDDGEYIIGPRKVPASFREVQVTQGRKEVRSKDGELIYPEYAVLFLVPPSGRDLSMINIHDSQTHMLQRRRTNPALVQELIRNSLAGKPGGISTEPSPTFVPSLPETVPEIAQSQPLTASKRRDSNLGEMIQFGRRPTLTGPLAIYGLLGHNQTESYEESDAMVPFPEETVPSKKDLEEMSTRSNQSGRAVAEEGTASGAVEVVVNGPVVEFAPPEPQRFDEHKGTTQEHGRVAAREKGHKWWHKRA
ncbi:sodium/hydrogen exchanger 10-like isoform X2 [Paramacrobiotus metropolitanus]|uniref:sodium/hydrogen exchanger 10-like isoform X2 n=1 Tax=Paramacrobiotus metropolitanus TaxID=2943436 RepID=UPI0024461472|nr:sodium/hydrogen exchanger 10-like isoform X2 [Paramacrobiotus metropolitanus]